MWHFYGFSNEEIDKYEFDHHLSLRHRGSDSKGLYLMIKAIFWSYEISNTRPK